MGWKFWKNRSDKEHLKPPPPVTMTHAAFSEAQRRFIDKHDKYVKPDHQLAVELLRIGAEYGKMTITYLVIGNSGGLAALLAIFPLIRESNQVWLIQQYSVAVAFAVGLFIAVVVAAFGYISFMGGVHTRWNIAHHNTVWIQGPEFGVDLEWARNVRNHHDRLQRRANRISSVSSWVAFTAAIVSGACWALGSYWLVEGLIATFRPV